MSIETLIVLSAVVLWVANGWYLNERLNVVHRKLDRVLEQFDGLRRYLYEIDPQFDDERALREAFEEGEARGAFPLDAMHLSELRARKREQGRRNLNSPFVD